MAICLASGVKAQFYDSADDIYFYVRTIDINSNEPNDLPLVDVLVFNFDGKRGTCFERFVEKTRTLLEQDPNYFENQLETAEYNLEYVPSTKNGTTYRWKSNWTGDYYTYTFSSNRNELFSSSHTGSKFVRVDRNFFRKKNIGRSRKPKSTLYE